MVTNAKTNPTAVLPAAPRRTRSGYPTGGDETVLRHMLGLPRRNASWTSLGGKSCAAWMSEPPPPETSSAVLWLLIDLGLFRFVAGIPADAAALLLDLPVTELRADVAPEMIAKLAELALDHALEEALPPIPRERLDVTLTDPPQVIRAIGMISAAGRQYEFALSWSGDDDKTAVELLNFLCPYKDLTPIPYTASLDFAVLRLSRADLSELGSGDVIVVGDQNPRETTYLNLRGRLWAPLRPHKDGYQLTGAPRLFRLPSSEAVMSEDKEQPLDQATIDELPVLVEFSLGDVDLMVSELKNLTQGYVFDYGVEPSRAVRIRVAGRTIGYGEIVELGGMYGVRLNARV